jgi:hypothetical protein
MAPWWEIRYFDRKNGLKTLNSAMVPFKLLPELDKMDIRGGHKFKTDEFEIAIPGSDITLHMPSKSLWIEGKPHHVPGASRVILFIKNYVRNDGAHWRYIYLGLMTEGGRGLIVKFNENDKTWELNIHPNGNSPDRSAKITAPSLPDYEND